MGSVSDVPVEATSCSDCAPVISPGAPWVLPETGEEAVESWVTGRLPGLTNKYHHGGLVFGEVPFTVDVGPVFDGDETFGEEEGPLDDNVEWEAAFCTAGFDEAAVCVVAEEPVSTELVGETFGVEDWASPSVTGQTVV